jgi:ketosteroid isomerase-like protein
MNHLKLGASLIAFALLPVFANAQAGTDQKVADEIIGMVKADWAARIADPTNIAAQNKNTADDYTEFNGSFATRIEGKAMAVRLAEAGSTGPGRVVASEMLNPKVQVYGNVAILTYNFAGMRKNKDGEIKPWRAKSTRVYAKQGDAWKLVHGNFAPDPVPND